MLSCTNPPCIIKHKKSSVNNLLGHNHSASEHGKISYKNASLKKKKKKSVNTFFF